MVENIVLDSIGDLGFAATIWLAFLENYYGAIICLAVAIAFHGIKYKIRESK